MMRAPAAYAIDYGAYGDRRRAFLSDELGCIFRVSWASTSALPRLSGSGRRSPPLLRYGRSGATSCLFGRMHYQFQTRPLIPLDLLRPE